MPSREEFFDKMLDGKNWLTTREKIALAGGNPNQDWLNRPIIEPQKGFETKGVTPRTTETKASVTRLDVETVTKSGDFEGYASLFGLRDGHDDIVQRGAFTASIAGTRRPKLLRAHDPNRIIGKWTDVSEDERGLKVAGTLFIDEVKDASETHALMREGVLDGLSIGFRTRDREFTEKDGDVVRVLKEIELWEISIVTFPSLDSAGITAVKELVGGDAIPLKRHVERALREAGASRDEAKACAAACATRIGEMREASAPADLAGMATDLKSMLKELSR